MPSVLHLLDSCLMMIRPDPALGRLPAGGPAPVADAQIASRNRILGSSAGINAPGLFRWWKRRRELPGVSRDDLTAVLAEHRRETREDLAAALDQYRRDSRGGTKSERFQIWVQAGGILLTIVAQDANVQRGGASGPDHPANLNAQYW